MTIRHTVVFLGLAALLGAQMPAHAERREDAAADAMRKAQLMIRKLSEEKTALQADKEQLSAKLKELEDKNSTLTSGLDQTREKLGQAKQHQEKLVGRIKSDVDKYKTLLEKYVDTSRILQRAMNDNGLLVNAVQERDGWISRCRADNQKLYQTGVDILKAYKNKGVADVIKDKEPVLGLGRVELETRVQDYRFKLEDLEVTPFQSATPAQARSGVPAAPAP